LRLNMKISKKLVIGFAVILILTSIISVISYINMGQLSASSELVDDSDQIQVKLLDARGEEKRYLLTSEATYIDTTKAAIKEAREICAEIKTMAVDAATIALVKDVEQGLTDYEAAFDAFVEAQKTCDSTLTAWKKAGENFNTLMTALKNGAEMGSEVYVQADIVEGAIAAMRPLGVYYMKDPGEATWAAEVAALDKTEAEIAKLVNMTSGMGQLSTDANSLYTDFLNYKALGYKYNEAEQAKAEADAAMTEAGNIVLGNANQADKYYGGAELLRNQAVVNAASVQAMSNIMVIGFAIAAIGISIPVAYLIIRSFQNPIKALIEDAKIISEGNLGHTMQAKVTKDEIGQVAGAFKNMVTSIRDLVAKVKTSAETVASMSQEVGSTAQEVNAGMEQVSTATQNISQGAQKLTNLAQEVSKNVNTLSSVLQQTGGTAAEGMKFGEQSTQIMQQIQKDSAKASTSIENMQNVMMNTAQTVESMHSSLAKIGELANMVTDVASQTEMLALNAAIEAARAGEAGRGFAVVADAVKELSDQSSNAANETLVSVSQVKKKGEEALEVSKKSTVEATEGAATVKAAIEGTKSVAEAIDKINKMLIDVGKGVEQGVLAVEQVVKAIDEVSAISEESASACEENSSAMQQQAASMNQLAQTSGKLSEVAAQLQKEIDKFKL